MGFVWVTRRNELEQFGWSLGECSCCQSIVAVRVEKVTEVIALYAFIPIGRKAVGQMLRCDFCERNVSRCIADKVVSRDEWNPMNGLPSLARKIIPDQRLPVPDNIPESQLHSLLSAAQSSSAPANVDVRLGIAIGVLTGPAIAIPVGLAFLDAGWIRPQLDRTGVAISCALCGVVIGVIFGGVTHAILKCAGVAYDKIRRTQRNYRVDLRALEIIAEGYNRRIRRAVRRARDDAGFDSRASSRQPRDFPDSIHPD